MKRMLLLLCLVLPLLPLAGCAGIVASGEMAAKIDANAVVGRSQMAKAQAQGYGDAEAAFEIAKNAQVFQDYLTAATTNIFAYLFKPDKTMLVKSDVYQALNETVAINNRILAIIDELTNAERNKVVEIQGFILIHVQDVKNGAKP